MACGQIAICLGSSEYGFLNGVLAVAFADEHSGNFDVAAWDLIYSLQ